MTYAVYQQNKYQRWGVNVEEFNRLCQDIAKEMNWQLEPASTGHANIESGKYRLSLNVDYCPAAGERSNPRIKIGTCGYMTETGKNIWNFIPKRELDNYKTEMTLSISRGVATIAKEIQKKLIPDYVKLYDAAYQAWRIDEDRTIAQENLTKEIAAVIDSRPSSNNKQTIYEYIKIGEKQNLRVEVNVSSLQYGHDLKINNLPTDMLIEILQLIKACATQSAYDHWLEQTQSKVLRRLNCWLELEETDNELTELPQSNFDWHNAYITNMMEYDIVKHFEKLVAQSVSVAA